MLNETFLRLAKRALLCSFALLWLAAWGFSQPAIILSPGRGSPTSTTLVSGTGFSALAEVDIYFDTTNLALAVANDNGSFSSIAIKVPASAVPGTHSVTAKERATGESAQASFVVRTLWTQFHRVLPQRYNRVENVLSPATVGGLDVLWDRSGEGYDNETPAVGNGGVYVGYAQVTGPVFGNISAYNVRNGTLMWRKLLAVGGAPAVANGVLYVGVGSNPYVPGGVYALDARTGDVLWMSPAGYYNFSSPAVVDGVVYDGADNGNVYALNAGTGALLWKYNTGGDVFSSPAVANGVVHVGSRDGNVYALNSTTGALRWKYTTGYRVDSSPAVANGVVYVGSEDNNVYALNASTGALLWKYATGSGVDSSPAVANGVVYISSYDGNVYALKGSTGRPLWKYPAGGSSSSPAVANRVVYVSSFQDGNVYALNASTGALLWKHAADIGSLAVDSSPAVTNGVVYVGSTAFGLTGSARPAAPERPDPKALSPNLDIPVSRPTARLPANDD